MPKKKVLYIVEDVEAAQFRYRVKNVIEALKDSAVWEADYVKTSEIYRANLKAVDLIVVLRQTAKNNKILDFIESVQRQGIKVLFDLDDLIFEYKDLPVLMKSINSKNVFYWVSYVWGIRRIAKKVNGFIATNNFLGKKLKNSFKKHCVIIPNSLAQAQVQISKELIENKPKNSNFTIGYFSGSPTHAKDFRLAEADIIKFLNEHDNARLKIVGYMELSGQIKRLMDDGKVETSPLVEPLELLKMISGVDVNIAPLLVNDFTNCKSELKFFEAAVVETATIASPTYAFERIIDDKENGLLAKDGEWLDKLNYLYDNVSKAKAIAKKARKDALLHFYGKRILKQVEGAYDYFKEH